MKRVLYILFFLVVCGFLQAQIPTAPIISNTSAAQRTDGSGLVDILYDLYDANGDLSSINLQLSNNGGITFHLTPSAANLSGDIGANIPSGAGKHIIWNAGAEAVDYDSNQFKLRILANDNTYPVPTNFLLVEGGTFNNGTSDVTISSFYIDKYEMTQGGYQAVMGINPSTGYGVGANYPVYNASWFKAIEYCNKRSITEQLTPCYSYSTFGTNPANWPNSWYNDDSNQFNIMCNWTANGYRLPTEMEWQFAAMGGNQTHNYTYSGSNAINDVVWYNENSGGTTHIVGTKAANELGLFDMTGNLWEWNWDLLGSYPSSPTINPHGPASGTNRIRRGGSFLDNDYANTVPFRNTVYPTFSEANVGFRVCRPLENFVIVEGGVFNNGTSAVTVSSFYMDKFELTQTGYKAVMGTNPSNFSSVDNGPVENVSWFNAIEYCNRRSIQEGLTPCYSYGAYGTNPTTWPAGWNTSDANHTNVACNWTATGYRLPTEAEWEFAARGGNLTHGYTYSGSNDINEVAWYSSNSGSTTHTVGTKTSNELGLYDMTGNVWEWCWDIYDIYPTNAQTNPHGSVIGVQRVERGGSWDNFPHESGILFRIHCYGTDTVIRTSLRLCKNAI